MVSNKRNSDLLKLHTVQRIESENKLLGLMNNMIQSIKHIESSKSKGDSSQLSGKIEYSRVLSFVPIRTADIWTKRHLYGNFREVGAYIENPAYVSYFITTSQE